MRRQKVRICALALGAHVVACGPETSSSGGGQGDAAHGGNEATAGVAGAHAGTAGSVATGGQTIQVGGTSGVGGRGHMDPLPDTDDDGIPDDDEIAGGTDPRVADSDGDGCDDLLEATFGECDEETMASVYSCDGAADLVLTMATGTGERMSDLMAEITPLDAGFAEDLWPRASEVTPLDAGDFADDGTLLFVEPGARVRYLVVPYVVFRWKGIRAYTLHISSAAGGILAEGKILWRRGDCPYIE